MPSIWQRSAESLPFGDEARVDWSATRGFLLAGSSGTGFALDSSQDGLTWLAEAVVGNDGASVSALAANATTPVAVGLKGNRGAAWVLQSGSPFWNGAIGTGTGFQPTTLPGKDVRTSVDDVTWNGKAFFAVGREFTCSGSCDTTAKGVVAMFSSGTGQSWRRVDLGKAEAKAFFSHIASSGSNLVAWSTTSGMRLVSNDSGKSWAIVRGADVIDPIVATSKGFLGIRDQDVMTSSNGRTWQRVGSVDAPSVDHWAGLVAVNDGYVLAGVAFTGAQSVPEAQLFVSTDSRTWTALPADPTLEGIELTQVTTDGARVVAYGHEGALRPGSARASFAATSSALFAAAR